MTVAKSLDVVLNSWGRFNALSLEFKKTLPRISPIDANFQKKSAKICVTPHWRAEQYSGKKNDEIRHAKTNSKLK
jgi:hypothetical protein